MGGAFSIGEWRVDPSLRTLSGVKGEVHLEPKHMQVLTVLAEHAGQVVSKERLLQTVWADTFVGDEALSKAISELRRSLGDDPKAPRFIQTIPKGGYRLVAAVTLGSSPHDEPGPSPASDTELIPAAPVSLRPRRLRRSMRPLLSLVGVSLGLAAIATVVWLLRPSREPARAPMRTVRLTTLPGIAECPTFSPDGRQVAFSWNGKMQDNFDLYVTFVGSSEVRRLTNDPLTDTLPRWSPDGRSIAFLRDRPDGTTIQLLSSLGGTDRRVSDFRGADSLSWSADSRWLAAGRPGRTHDTVSLPDDRGIYLIPVEGGEPRRLIAANAQTFVSNPAFSPDGKRLAYASCAIVGTTGAIGGCDVYVVNLDPTLAPVGLPRRITGERLLGITSISWTLDQRDLIYAGATDYADGLWRVSADRNGTSQRIEIAGGGVNEPAIAPTGDRVAFSHGAWNHGIWRLEIGRPVQPLIGLSLAEEQPRLSSDGRRVAFASTHSGNRSEIFLADADGSNVSQLTRGPGREQGSPFWSPDGLHLVFDSLTDDSHRHVWMIDADGGMPRRVTTETGDQVVPTWSHDGRWVYYAADSGDGNDIWRIPARGGTPERITHGGSGLFACESTNGKSLVYQPHSGDSPLMMMPVTGGATRQLVPCVRGSAFACALPGLYYVPCSSDRTPPDFQLRSFGASAPAVSFSQTPAIEVMDWENSRTQRLGTLDNLLESPLGLAVSPDGKTILYTRTLNRDSGLMVIENFR